MFLFCHTKNKVEMLASNSLEKRTIRDVSTRSSFLKAKGSPLVSCLSYEYLGARTGGWGEK